jgi:solute carrier family 25 carnitine/acylcarnitine transporter 20/29
MAANNFCSDLIAGTAGGVCGIVVGQPADTVKVRLQTQSAQSSKTAVDVASGIFRSDGFRGFFRGLVAPVLTNAPINATTFVIYGSVIRHFDKPSGSLNPGHHFLAGSAAGLMQCVFACPGELLKIKQQAADSVLKAPRGSVHTTPKPLSTLALAKQVVRAHGVARGLFQGWFLTCARDVPSFGLYFSSYEVSKRYLESRAWSLPAASLASGAVAGVVPWFLTHPIDVLKSCRQSARTCIKYHASEKGVATIKDPAHGCVWQEGPSSTWAIARSRYRIHGWRFFTRGLTPSILRAVPVNAVTFAVYEQVILLL